MAMAELACPSDGDGGGGGANTGGGGLGRRRRARAAIAADVRGVSSRDRGLWMKTRAGNGVGFGGGGVVRRVDGCNASIGGGGGSNAGDGGSDAGDGFDGSGNRGRGLRRRAGDRAGVGGVINSSIFGSSAGFGDDSGDGFLGQGLWGRAMEGFGIDRGGGGVSGGAVEVRGKCRRERWGDDDQWFGSVMERQWTDRDNYSRGDGLKEAALGGEWSTRTGGGRELGGSGQRVDCESDVQRVECEDSERMVTGVNKLFDPESRDDHRSTHLDPRNDAHIDPIRTKKKGRGICTQEFFKHKGENLHKLEWNKYGQVIGENASKLRAACAYYAHCHWLWPIDKNWKEMPQSAWIDTWELLKADFHLGGHPNAFNFVFDIVHDRHKDWKSTVKSIWTTHENAPERLKQELLKNPRINMTQFSNATKAWATHESKEKALINRNNCKKKILHHRCGRRPLAAKRQDFEKENRREPTDIEMMKIMYPKEGKVGEVERYIQQSHQDHMHSPSEDIMSRAYLHIVGVGKSDYVYFRGTGHEKSHKRLEYERLQSFLLKNRDEQESTEKLKSVVASQATLIQQQRAWMQQHTLWMHRVSRHVGFACPSPFPQDALDFSQMNVRSIHNSSDRSNGNCDVNTNGGIRDGDMPSSSAFGFPSQAGGNPDFNPYGGPPMDPFFFRSRGHFQNQPSEGHTNTPPTNNRGGQSVDSVQRSSHSRDMNQGLFASQIRK